jgi:hypothetical protein
MDIKVKATQQGNSVVLSENERGDGVWISIHRPRAYTSTLLTRAQTEELRDALIALMSKPNAAQ